MGTIPLNIPPTNSPAAPATMTPASTVHDGQEGWVTLTNAIAASPLPQAGAMAIVQMTRSIFGTRVVGDRSLE